MRVRFHCPLCPPDAVEVVIPIATEVATPMICNLGHQGVLRIQNPPYSLLFERSLVRLALGATRDAVTDAFTALEMYLAHVPIRIRHHTEQLAPHLLGEQLSVAHATSERALGAALGALSLSSRKAPPTYPTSIPTLRNIAVHRGHHPAQEKAMIFCETVEHFIAECEALMPYSNDGERASYWQAITVQASAGAVAGGPIGHGLVLVGCVLDLPKVDAPKARARVEKYTSVPEMMDALVMPI